MPEGSPFPTSEIWYADSTKARKIIGCEVTYNSTKQITKSVVKTYNGDGTLDKTITDTISYSGAQPFQTTRVVT